MLLIFIVYLRFHGIYSRFVKKYSRSQVKYSRTFQLYPRFSFFMSWNSVQTSNAYLIRGLIFPFKIELLPRIMIFIVYSRFHRIYSRSVKKYSRSQVKYSRTFQLYPRFSFFMSWNSVQTSRYRHLPLPKQ